MRYFIDNYENPNIKNLLFDYSKKIKIAVGSIKSCITAFTSIDVDRITRHSDFVENVKDNLLADLNAKFPK